MEKAQAYHELRLYLACLLPEYSVELITFVMTVSDSIPAATWDHNFNLLGLGDRGANKYYGTPLYTLFKDCMSFWVCRRPAYLTGYRPLSGCR
eukprot:2923783-Rhodomonas_salina.2